MGAQIAWHRRASELARRESRSEPIQGDFLQEQPLAPGTRGPQTAALPAVSLALRSGLRWPGVGGAGELGWAAGEASRGRPVRSAPAPSSRAAPPPRPWPGSSQVLSLASPSFLLQRPPLLPVPPPAPLPSSGSSSAVRFLCAPYVPRPRIPETAGP